MTMVKLIELPHSFHPSFTLDFMLTVSQIWSIILTLFQDIFLRMFLRP